MLVSLTTDICRLEVIYRKLSYSCLHNISVRYCCVVPFQKAISFSQFPSASVHDFIQKAGMPVEETELDDENDRTVYSVKIVKGNQELEVKVDALTGEVVKVEQD